MSKFTPGPWHIHEEYRDEIRGNANEMVCSTYANKNEVSNVRLIATAPEMYAKLEKVATWLEKNAALKDDYADRCRDLKSIADEERTNASNYRATAKDIRKLLAKADAEAL